ncbi:MAG: hypothetical protein AAGG50_14410, partial [Bacteroidota bacterium]
MWTPTSDLVRDLDLKRAALLPPADRPVLDARALIAELDTERAADGTDRLLFVREDGQDVRFDPARLAALVAEAWTSARLADDQAADADALAPFLRRIVGDVLDRLVALPAEARLSFAEVVALAEASLLGMGAVEVAKA